MEASTSNAIKKERGLELQPSQTFTPLIRTLLTFISFPGCKLEATWMTGNKGTVWRQMIRAAVQEASRRARFGGSEPPSYCPATNGDNRGAYLSNVTPSTSQCRISSPQKRLLQYASSRLRDYAMPSIDQSQLAPHLLPQCGRPGCTYALCFFLSDALDGRGSHENQTRQCDQAIYPQPHIGSYPRNIPRRDGERPLRRTCVYYPSSSTMRDAI